MLIHPPRGALVWPAAMIVWGPGYRSAAHGHHCVQLVMALRGTLQVRGKPSERWRRCGAVLVRPDAIHEVDARGGGVLIGFVDAESELGAALHERVDDDLSVVSSRQVARWRQTLGPAPSEATVARWVSADLLRRRAVVMIHPRVRRALRYLRARIGTSDDLSLDALAAVAKLSPSRFMHAFTESLGVPLRPYIRWLRLQRAASNLMDGATISQAAHRAGFADAAHLTRTFRRMLGTTPSDIAVRKDASKAVSLE